MTERDRAVIFPLNGGDGELDRLGGYDDLAPAGDRSSDFVPGLVSLGFMTAAARRSAVFLFVMAVVGLIAGVGAYVARPHNYQATASILITLSPYENSQAAPADNQAIAETRSVAALAVQQLGLQQDPGSFQSSYIAASITDRLMTITASGPSADEAVLRATAVASAFLKFRAEQLQAEFNLTQQSLEQQINQAQQHLNSINTQIRQLSGQPGEQSQLSKLQADQTSTTSALTSYQQAVIGNQSTTQPALTAALKGSQVLTVAPGAHSRFKPLIIYGGGGLIAGLGVGLTIVIIRALVSDRLRRRDDIAYALDAPVKLSVHSLGARRRLIPRPGRGAKRDLDMRRIVAHLRSAVPRSTHGPVSLAVVAVDNAPVVAQAVAALAATYVGQRTQVVTADLSRGADLARLSGVKGPGSHQVSRNGMSFTIVVPDRGDPAPCGPLPPLSSPAPGAEALVPSDVSADLLLTLATLDPALGADYLATWATSAVVVVSAGKSSAERIHGVGEMVRLAGLRLASVVLIGADKLDESIGLMGRTDEQAGLGVLGR